METASIILDFLRVLIWPLILLSALVLFRYQLRSIINSLGKSLSKVRLPAGMELEFGGRNEYKQEIVEAREELAETEAKSRDFKATLGRAEQERFSSAIESQLKSLGEKLERAEEEADKHFSRAEMESRVLQVLDRASNPLTGDQLANILGVPYIGIMSAILRLFKKDLVTSLQVGEETYYAPKIEPPPVL